MTGEPLFGSVIAASCWRFGPEWVIEYVSPPPELSFEAVTNVIVPPTDWLVRSAKPLLAV